MRGFSIALLFVIVALSSQAQNIFLKTTGETGFVCGQDINFSIEVRNLTTSQHFTNVVVKSKFPTGITFAGEQGASYHQAGSDPGHPVFVISSIPATGVVTIRFTAKTDCNLITYFNERGIVNGLVNNATEVTYMVGNTTLPVFKEPDGSASYNIYYPVLNLQINPADKSQTATGMEKVLRRITVQNTGNGKVAASNLLLEINRESSLTHVSITGGNTTLDNSVPNRTLVRFNDLTGVGNNDNYLDPGESLTLSETVLVNRNTCSDLNLQTNYFIKWGCNGNICNLGSNNSQDASTVLVPNGDPLVSSQGYPIDGNLTYCAPAEEMRFEFLNQRAKVNATTDKANRATNIELQISEGSGFTSLTNFKVLTKQGTWVSVTPSSTSGTTLKRYYFTSSAFAGIAENVQGLSDADGNGGYDDIMPQDKITLSATAAVGCPLQYSTPNFSTTLYFFQTSTLYYTSCGSFRNEGGSLSGYHNNTLNLAKLTGPIDLTPGKTGVYQFQISRSIYDGYLTCSSKTFTSTLNFPSLAYKVTAVRWYNNNGSTATVMPFSQSADGTLNVTGGGWLGRFEVDVTLDCSLGATQTASSMLQWNMYYDCSGTCCRQFIGQSSYEIFNHCGGPGTGGECIRTSEFTVERTTYGYAEPASGYYTQLPPTKLTRNSPGIRPNAGMETDELLAVAPGTVLGGTFNNAHVEIQYTSPVSDNILQFMSGSFIVNTGSGDQTYVVSPPEVTQNGTVFYFDFKLEGVTLPPGTKVDLHANFRIRKTESLSPGDFELQRFRAFHYGLVSSNRLGCESFGASFYVVKAYYRFGSQGTYRSYGCKSPLNPYVYLFPYGVGSSDPFPNEFRPNTRVTQIQATVPKGMSYRANSATLRNIQTMTLPAPTETANADGSKVLTWSSGLPVFDVQLNFRNILFQFYSDVTCFKDIPVSPAAPVTINYTNYEFDAGSTQALSGTEAIVPARSISTLTLQSNVTQDAFAETVTWPVTMCEGSSGETEDYNWLTFEPPANINLLSAKVNGVDLQIVAYDPSAPHKRLIKVGAIGLNKCTVIQLTASYTDCKENVVDNIALKAGRTCGGYPSNPAEVECKDIQTPVPGTLSIRYKNADMAQSVLELSDRSNLCEAIPYQVELLSSGLGDMNDVFLFLDLPQGIVFRPGSASYQIPSVSTTWISLPDAAPATAHGISTDDAWDLSTLALGGNPFAKETRILVRFDLEASCSESFETNFDPGIPVVITSAGKTNCGDIVTRRFQSKIEINGFIVTGNEMIPNISVNEICINGFAPSISVSVTNDGIAPSIEQDLVVTLPAGLDYLAAVKGAPLPSSVLRTPLFTLITWKLAAGIAPDQTITGFDFIVTIDDSTLDSVRVETRTYIYGTGTCTETGQSCLLRATTGLSRAVVTVQKDNCYKCQDPEPKITGDCAGKETRFDAWNGAEVSVSCAGDHLVIKNTGTSGMTDSLSYTAYYAVRGNEQEIQTVSIDRFKLTSSDSIVIRHTESVSNMILVRLEVEQAPFHPQNSGIIVTLTGSSSSAYCSRVSQQYLTPLTISWKFGDGGTAIGASVTHTYADPGTYTVTVAYCGDKTMDVTYTATDCKILDLSMYDNCSFDPQVYRWTVSNPNNIDIAIEYQVPNSPFRKKLTVRAAKDTTFSTPVIAANKSLRISWLNEKGETHEVTGSTNGRLCEEETCDDCFSSFSLLEGKEYILSAWVREDAPAGTLTFSNATVQLFFEGDRGETSMDFHAEGVIIDGWQRVWTRFTVPAEVDYLTIRLLNNGPHQAYFDDIRIHPFNANMKSFVYDPNNQRLMAELDENNYATFYEYDEEGALIRVKKETERGVKTVQESRNNTVKHANGQ